MLATEMCFISSSRKHYFLVPSLVYFLESGVLVHLPNVTLFLHYELLLLSIRTNIFNMYRLIFFFVIVTEVLLDMVASGAELGWLTSPIERGVSLSYIFLFHVVLK